MRPSKVMVAQRPLDEAHHSRTRSGGSRGRAVVPVAPRLHWLPKSVVVGRELPPSPRASQIQVANEHLSFTEGFGTLGFPMLLILLVCIAWTSWLILLTCAPTRTANYLMNTEEFDDGDFWVIVDTGLWMKALSLSGLIFIALFYVYVFLKMVLWRNEASNGLIRLARRSKLWKRVAQITRVPRSWKRNKMFELWDDLTGFHGTKRKFWNLWLKTIDLTLQSIALGQMLNSGLPKGIVYGYVTLIAANSFSCVIMILLGDKHSAFTEVLIDSIFDLLFAVVTPIVVLAYCYSNFDLDREELRINIELLPAGSFERQARLTSNPSEVFLFRTSFDSLRILSTTDFLIRIGMNLSFCNRFKRVVEVQIARRQREMIRRRHRSSFLQAAQQMHVPRIVALAFALFGLVVLMLTHESVMESAEACAAYPECVAHARRRNVGATCPCLILIDTDKEPKTWETWINPVDKTEAVRELARSGHLRVFELINRRLQILPEELQYCTHMRHITVEIPGVASTLMYTDLSELPPWVKTFKELQYLHIEGKNGFENLQSLPDDLFADMHSLSVFHLGVHAWLPRLPSFEGLSNLRQLLLAYLFSVTELPSFEPLKKLERLNIIYHPVLRGIPDMAPLSKLREFTSFRPMQTCCNGFFGACNLTHPYCTLNAVLSIPQATCLEDGAKRATVVTQRYFQENAAAFCQATSMVVAETPTKANIDMCTGTLFRKCELPGRLQANGSRIPIPGMCLNTRMQVIACTSDPLKVQVRKLQILRGVGPVCDPAVEAWLGCK